MIILEITKTTQICYRFSILHEQACYLDQMYNLLQR